MFRISVLVEDKKLAEVLRNMTGKVNNLEVVPVVLGDEVLPVKKERKVKSNRRDITPKWFGFRKGGLLTPSSLAPALKAKKLSPKSMSYVVARMLKEQTIKRISLGKYEVT